MREKKILAVFYRDVDCDGCQMYLLNTLGHMDLSGYQVDFYTPGHIVSQEQAARLESVGKGRLYAAGVKTESDKLVCKLAAIVLSLKKLLREREYDIIHVSAGSLAFQTVVITTARCCGVPVRIAHAQNTAAEHSRAKEAVYVFLRAVLVRNMTDAAACSHIAAKFLFGRHAREAEYIPNAIDVKRFAFRKDVREECRRELKLEKHFLVGHVGRFSEQKNHRFLIRIFQQLVEIEPLARLLLIGDGPLMEEIRDLAGALGIKDKVIFTGLSDEVERFMCAMDVFALPSIHEGLGIVNIEAQASGLPCVVSDMCPQEAKVNDLFEFLPLSTGERVWAEHILAMGRKVSLSEREHAWEKAYESGYDVHSIENIYDACEKSNGLEPGG